MSDSRDESPNEDYFNDLSQHLPGQRPQIDRQDSREENGEIPKVRRIACVLCRKRKLKCDGEKPMCGTCKRLQHDCSYDEVRRKSGPKRGYVKALEARLAQVETLLKTQDDQPATGKDKIAGTNGRTETNGHNGSVPDYADITMDAGDGLPNLSNGIHDDLLANGLGLDPSMPEGDDQFPWEMIGLGLDEPLPKQEVIDELNNIYFEKIHPSAPMIHRARFYVAMHLAPQMRPPVCLRYAMWCAAAAASDKYEALSEHFYQRARKYIQQDEMRGHGESMITVAHCQTWIILASYEFKMMYFPRAWASSGRSSRLAQMMGLHRLDGNGLDVKQCLPPPKDWTEKEERRRTFWYAFCVDRYSSIGTGWPMTFDERDILSNLPADEQAYELNRPARTGTLEDAMSMGGPQNLSSLGGVVLMACLFGRNLVHLHRPTPEDKDDDLNGEFWKRHRHLDNVLLNTSLALPDALRIPVGINNPNVVFMNMNIHTSTICLHQAAIFKADKNRMAARISTESKMRCITAAAEIASIMRQICHLDLATMSPFISFCLYVAARVFVQYLKSRPKDDQIRASLQFLLTAMHAIKRKNPLTESFIVQLDVDLEGAGLDEQRSLRQTAAKGATNMYTRATACSHTHLAMKNMQHHTTYGDNGVASYNNPADGDLATSAAPQTNSANSFPYHTTPHTNGEMPFHGIIEMTLPNRQRSPGSSNMSPARYTGDMDTSPSGSGLGNNSSRGGADTNTPNSSTHNPPSSYASHDDLTPPMHQQQQHPQPQPPSLDHIFDPAAQVLSNDLDFDFLAPGTTPQTTNGHTNGTFQVPQTWNGTVSTGMTPNASMMAGHGIGTPALGDMISMSEAEWNQYMEGFSGWDPNLTPHDAAVTSAAGRS